MGPGETGFVPPYFLLSVYIYKKQTDKSLVCIQGSKVGAFRNQTTKEWIMNSGFVFCCIFLKTGEWAPCDFLKNRTTILVPASLTPAERLCRKPRGRQERGTSRKERGNHRLQDHSARGISFYNYGCDRQK